MFGNVTVMTINTTVTIYWGYVTRRDGLLIDGDDILSKIRVESRMARKCAVNLLCSGK